VYLKIAKTFCKNFMKNLRGLSSGLLESFGYPQLQRSAISVVKDSKMGRAPEERNIPLLWSLRFEGWEDYKDAAPLELGH
jgi:hypothetical protein